MKVVLGEVNSPGKGEISNMRRECSHQVLRAEVEYCYSLPARTAGNAIPLTEVDELFHESSTPNGSAVIEALKESNAC